MKLIALLLSLPWLVSAQFYIVSTVAGNGRLSLKDGNSAINSLLIQPYCVAVDSAGNVYFSEVYYDQVFKITTSGTIAAYAGNGQSGFSGDSLPATQAQINGPRGLATDSAGNLFIADAGNGRVRKVAVDGTITTVAGNGQLGATGDGGAATSAAVANPAGVAVDAAGNLYISQSADHVIRMVDTNNKISTIAGTGAPGFSGDGLKATTANLFAPLGLRVDAAGTVYVADSMNQRIRKITQGIITTIAGNGKPTLAGNGGLATAASLDAPSDVALDAAGNLYIADTSNGRVRIVTASNNLIADFTGQGSSFADGPANQARTLAPSGVTLDSKGNVLLALFAGREIRRVSQGTITTIAGAPPPTLVGENVPATSTPLFDPFGVAVDPAGNVYVSDDFDHRIRRVTSAGIVNTYAGNGLDGSTGDGGPATNAQVGAPRGLALDQAGNLYVATGNGFLVRQIAPNGNSITTIAGGGSSTAEGVKATTAQLLSPVSAVRDAAGNTYISDSNNHRIRRVDTSGIITTIAGTGTPAYGGDKGPAAAASLFFPRQLALDKNNNLYVADSGNSRVRMITPGGIITTVAGSGVTSGNAGDGGPAIDATVPAPTGVAVDAAGNLYIASSGRIRKVDASTGKSNVIAGNGNLGFSGDGDLATSAALNGAQSLALDASGNLYFTDKGNLRVRVLTPAQIVPQGVVNGATFKPGAVAPGEIITIFGSSLGPAAGAGLQLDASGRVATLLAGTQVLFDGVAAPIVFLIDSQVNVVVPYEVAGNASTKVQVTIQGKPTNTITLPVAASSPGVFAITNQDGSVNSASNPAAPNSILVLYGTGEGQTNPPGVDGNVNSSVFPAPVLPVSVKIGGQTAGLPYAGAGPGFVAGVLQIDAQIPAGVSGTVPLQLQIGNATTPSPLTVYVRSQ